jgi:membrane protein implicated in regulation of membrane protease activity
MMGTTFRDLIQVMSSRRFWRASIGLAVLTAFGLAILLVAFTALLVLLPIALLGGLALHIYVRRRLRQAGPKDRRSDAVIEGEYTVIDRREEADH